MKRYEKESFLKSFLLFFMVQLLFLSVVMWQEHKRVVHQYEMHIMHKMTECSYSLECPEFQMDFVNKLKRYETNIFYEEQNYFMLFSITEDKEHYLQFTLSRKVYENAYKALLYEVGVKYLIGIVILIIISVFFAQVSLRPLRKALALNDEFVKDMLHDFNTPLSSLKINFKLLQKKFGADSAMVRSEHAMQNIENLQANLTSFLSHNPLNQELFDVAVIVEQSIENYAHIFHEIHFENHIKSLTINSNPNAFSRIIDNLLSNAGKYNKKNGFVKIYLQNRHLVIEDSGIGIKNPHKVFERFYKETSRGMGIGLHVVQKLCDELGIEIKVHSEVNKGTMFLINLEKLMLR